MISFKVIDPSDVYFGAKMEIVMCYVIKRQSCQNSEQKNNDFKLFQKYCIKQIKAYHVIYNLANTDCNFSLDLRENMMHQVVSNLRILWKWVVKQKSMEIVLYCSPF